MPTREPATRGSTILLVEADGALRRWLAVLLEEVGYHVLQAGSGPETLHCIRRHDTIDLVITDARIAGMPGSEIAREVANLRPGIPIVRLISTMAEGLPICRADLDPSVLLWKPFTLPQLLDLVREHLSHQPDQAHEVHSYTFLP
jgi:CheY-like chemotaxis protein